MWSGAYIVLDCLDRENIVTQKMTYLTFAHFIEMTQVKGQHLLWLFDGSSIWCYELTDNINNLFFAHTFVLYEVFRPFREFFTLMEMSPLPVNGCKFWPMLVTYMYGHWAVKVL